MVYFGVLGFSDGYMDLVRFSIVEWNLVWCFLV